MATFTQSSLLADTVVMGPLIEHRVCTSTQSRSPSRPYPQGQRKAARRNPERISLEQDPDRVQRALGIFLMHLLAITGLPFGTDRGRVTWQTEATRRQRWSHQEGFHAPLREETSRLPAFSKACTRRKSVAGRVTWVNCGREELHAGRTGVLSEVCWVNDSLRSPRALRMWDAGCEEHVADVSRSPT
jgi:hypothetical protein